MSMMADYFDGTPTHRDDDGNEAPVSDGSKLKSFLYPLEIRDNARKLWQPLFEKDRKYMRMEGCEPLTDQEQQDMELYQEICEAMV